MTVYYTLKSGERLSMFFWDDYYPGKEVFHLPLEITEIDITSPGTDGYCYKTRKSIKYPGEMEACTHQLILYEDDDSVRYFIWKGERVNIMDWDYHHILLLCEEIEYAKQIKNRWFVPRNIILSSLMKQPDKFAVMLQPRVATCRIPGTTICLMSDERTKEFIPYVPYIHPMREVKNWYYKIDLWPKDEQLRQYCGHEEYYFDDFCSLLHEDILKLVEIKEEEKMETNTKNIKPDMKFRISGDADIIIRDSDYHVRVDSEVTIIDYPNEDGWVMVTIDYIDGDSDVSVFVKTDTLKPI